MRVDGTNLLDGIAPDTRQKTADYGTVSTGNSAKTQHVHESVRDGRVADVTYAKPGQDEHKGGTVADIMQQASDMDAVQKKNEMVVASNTTTAKDCEKIEQDGFSLDQTEAATIVTETDKIKMQLAKAGVDISYFGDSLSAEQLEAVMGNAALAQELIGRMQQADLPFTPDNTEDFQKASEQAGELGSLSDGALKYMLDNGLAPTIDNLYRAQYSGSAVYVSPVQPGIDFSQMSGQISHIIAQAGYEVNSETLSDSQWMIQNDIPFTAQNLRYLKQLQTFVPPSDEQVADAMVTAVSEGKRPQDGALLSGFSLADRAQHTVDVLEQATDEDVAYVVEQGKTVTIGELEQAHDELAAYATEAADVTGQDMQTSGTVENAGQRGDTQLAVITARRQLEEVRLVMTVEVSYVMLKQGISVDTQSMEELIVQLREAEQLYYRNLLEEGGITATQENVSLFAGTVDTLTQLKEMPAYALGVKHVDVSTFRGLYEAGSELQQHFAQAGERYETMQTEVRTDLGDSIQKAFENIDDILKELGVAESAENERAVRILAYNRTEITVTRMMQMKAADLQVQTAFKNLTPAVVRGMIGRGINPLDMDITELNRLAVQIRQEDGPEHEQEKYSEYLYKLEQSKSITTDERDAYIGIYRLMNRVVQSDGAAVGALVNQGAPLTMRNLLTAVRTGQRGKIDAVVDNNYGELQSGGYTDSITGQIEAGYQHACMERAFAEVSPERLHRVMGEEGWENLTPEQFLQRIQEAPEDVAAQEAYYRQKLDDLTQSAQASKDVYAALDECEMPCTVQNVIAMSQLMRDRNSAYRRFFAQNDNGRTPDAQLSADDYMTVDEDGGAQVDFEAVKQELLQRCSEDMKRPKGLAQAMAQLAECAEHCMATMLTDTDASSIDIREMKLMNTQLAIGARMAQDECFSLPVVIDGEVTNVTLKVVRGKKEKGNVCIALETPQLGRIAAQLRAGRDGISGYVAADSALSADWLAQREELFQKAVAPDSETRVDLQFVRVVSLDLNHFTASAGKSARPESEELMQVQTKELYAMAEGFIRTLTKLTK